MSTKFDLSFVQGLSVKEKAELISGKNFWFTAKNDDKNIPALMMTDGPSGLRKQAESSALDVNKSVEAICFPSSALTACSFNVQMMQELGHHLGIAARSENVDLLLGPGINIKRTPLAGRNFEYFSEDPYLIGELASSYVKGVQSKGVGVSLKHFAANNRENQRFTATSNIDERTLREIYLSAFEKIVKEAHPATIMCSYNPINGDLNSQNYRLLTKILRDEWGFEGAVISDWGAVADIIAAINAGLDLEMPGNGEYTTERVIDSVKDGTLDEAKLDTAALRILRTVENYHVNARKVEQYDKNEQHDFAKKIAEDGMVLLQNDAHLLPINNSEKISIIGELAENPRYQGSGSSHVNAYKIVTPLKIAKNSDYQIKYARGYKLAEDVVDQNLVKEALDTAKTSDKVIIFAGFPDQMESEGFDKKTIDLPSNQNELISQISKVNSNIIVVLQNGSAVTMPWKNEVKSILETYLAGEAVGEATWEILTGAVNPSGKLAETFPNKIEDTPSYGTFNASLREENYHEGIFVGYRYYDSKRLNVNFPFGHGLSYTSYKYDNLKVTESGDHVNVSLDVSNTGKVSGKETVQLYIQNLTSPVEVPVRELKAFTKVDLVPNETKTVKLTLNRRSFAWFDSLINTWRVDNGKYVISLGSSSRDIRLNQDIEIGLGSDVDQSISGDTYLSEIIGRTDLEDALNESGINKVIKSVTSMGDNQEMMSNTPLRSVIMMGATMTQINKFVELANKKQ